MTRWRPAGDAALLLQAEGLAARLAAAIGRERIAGVLDVVPGAGTVLVTTGPGTVDLGQLAARVLALPLPAASPAAAALTEIPVVYDGPDLAEVARLTGLPPDEVVARHVAGEYTVGWLGFSPGFGYLTGLDPVLASVPRMTEPRLRVPAGAVAIAGGLAAVYPSASPGGWRLLGRTAAVLWDPDRDPPAVLAPGMRVRFRPVPQPPATLTPPAPGQAGAFHDPGAKRAVYTQDAPGSWKSGTPARATPGGSPVIEVLRPGALATVQDLGRRGFGHLGVPGSGAADTASLRLANRLAGNPEGAAGLELTLGRAGFRFPAGAWVAVTGAPAPVTLKTGPGDGASSDMRHGETFWVPAGGQVQVGAPAVGLRCYLAVRGGIDVPPVLGSRSADLRSGLGPAPLRRGDLLPLGEPAEAGMAQAGMAQAGVARAAAAEDLAGRVSSAVTPGIPGAGEAAELRVIAGPRDDWFAPGALDVLCGGTYVVTPDSDRTGLRLDGPALTRARPDELPSEGLATGALQVTLGGRPILMLADHPVTGGYPVIGVVASADVGLAAQLRPGSRIRFLLSRG